MDQDLHRAMEQLTPDEYQKQRVWNKIQEKQTKRTPLWRGLKIAVPALSLALVVAVSLWSMGLFTGNPNTQSLVTAPPGRFDNAAEPGPAEIDLADGRDMAVVPLNQFTLKGRVYFLLDPSLFEQFGFDQTISAQQIGDKIATIDTAAAPALKGKEVYAYLPAKAEAVVAVKLDDGYKLYKFLNFKSYENNQDEDAIEYLKLYGIHSADDIAAIQFIGYSEQAKLENRLDIRAQVTDPAEIAKFYEYYAVLKNASDKYFEALYAYRASITPTRPEEAVPPPDLPPDDAVPPVAPGRDEPSPNASDTPAWDLPIDNGGTDYRTDPGTAGEVTPSPGSVGGTTGSAAGALADAQTIRICAKSGLYFETIYYPNIGFISRHQLSAELADWLAAYVK